MPATIADMPFAPFLPPHATAIMMGTLPPTPDKWTMPFYYPNFHNDMWRIYGLVFFGDSAHFLAADRQRFDADKIRAFLHERGIALCSTVRKALRTRGNAADEHLQILETVDMPAILAQVPKVRHILASGTLAADILLSLQDTPCKAPKAGDSVPYHCAGRALHLWRLPSSSRAHRMALAKKADIYRAVLQNCGLLHD